jgi:hypothetical protein
MSAATAVNEEASRDFAEAAIPLLKEYAQKLNSLRDKVQAIQDLYLRETKQRQQILKAEYRHWEGLFRRLRPPATNLAQQVSQRIEHGRQADLNSVEMKLRLAEFEHALLGNEELFRSFHP